MELQDQNVLCPDCGVNYITIKRFNDYKKCISCARRETIANTTNMPYVKWIDLSDDEKERLEKQREKNNKSAKIRARQVTKTNGTTLPAEVLVKKFLDSKNYLTGGDISIKTTEIYSQFSVYCSSHYYTLLSRHELYSILIEKFGFKKKMSYGINYLRLEGNINISLKSNKTADLVSEIKKENLKSNQIYTQEMIDYLISIADETKTVSELREALLKKYPDKKITASNFNNIIARRKIPHFISNGFKLIKPTEVDTVTVDTNEIEEPQLTIEDMKPVVSDKRDIENDRLVPIKEEVIKVLQTKFTAMKCKTMNDFKLDDYINMIELFIYLMHNIDNIISVRNNQYDIANWYQDEIIHEMENELAESGNTYLQDKMYILRDIRRYIESDRDALKQMRVFLKNLNKVFPESDAKKVIGQLKHINENVKQPKFIPTVDLGMVNKYSWATYGSPASAKNNKTVLTTNAVEKFMNEKAEDIKTININGTKTHLSKDEIDRGFKVYRVSCNISGGGYGAFKPWYKDYPCINADIAMSFAQQEFARMKASNSSLLFTDVKVHQLNVV